MTVDEARHDLGCLTFAEYLALPEPEWHTEWVDGLAVPMPPVTDEHSQTHVWLTTLLRIVVQEWRLGRVFNRPFHMKTSPDLPGRSPDLFYVSDRNCARLCKHYLDGPADLVVEVVDRESQTRDRIHKFAEYERGGVPEYWLIDPDRRTADFFRRGRNGKYKPVPPEDGVYHSKAVPGVWVKLDWLWQRPLPSTLDVLKAWGAI